MSKQKQNEKTFENWAALPEGGRRYWRDIHGHNNWKARYVKEVDQEENTVRFLQEIYNNMGQLVEIHEKHPIDEGHRKTEEGEI